MFKVIKNLFKKKVRKPLEFDQVEYFNLVAKHSKHNFDDLIEFGISDGWKNIDLEFYIKYNNFIQASKITTEELTDDEKTYLFLSFVEGKTVEEIKQTPKFLLDTLSKKWLFLTENIHNTEIKEPFIEIEDKMYPIVNDFNYLSLEQWQNADEYFKEGFEDNNFTKNIHILIAITSLSREEYTLPKALKLSEKILKTKMYYIIPSLNFFLFKEEISSTNMLQFLKKLETQTLSSLVAMTKHTPTSAKVGDGTIRLTRWQMVILQGILKLWLKLYKKF